MPRTREILSLKQIITRCKTLALGGCRALHPRGRHHPSEHSNNSGSSSVLPPRPGHLAVYVGPERARFVIPTRFLNFPVFVALLKIAEEEFGFQSSGALAIPCDAGFFGGIVELLQEDEGRYRSVGIDAFSEMVAAACGKGESFRGGGGGRANAFPPLLQKEGF